MRLGLGNLESKLGRNDQAPAAYSDALTLYKQEDSRLGQANVQRGLGKLESKLGRNKETRAAYTAAVELYGELGLEKERQAALEALNRLNAKARRH